MIAACLVMSPLASAQEPVASPPPKLSASECEVWARELGFARSVAEHDAAAFAGFVAEGAVFGAKRPNPRRGRAAGGGGGGEQGGGQGISPGGVAKKGAEGGGARKA
jgi:hypothetical protein